MKQKASTNSYSEQADINCPVCGETIRVDIWLIIDVSEKIDLVQQVLGSSLNNIKCPKCANGVLLDTPLLLVNSEQHSPLIFSPSSEATEEESKNEAFHLMSILRNRAGKGWQDKSSLDVYAIKRQFLSTVLSKWFGETTKESNKQPTPESKISLELQAIIEELARPTNQSDMEYRAKLCHQALSLVDQKETPELWAKLQCELGNSLAQSLSINKAENLELSIKSYKLVLEAFTREEIPVDWALIMMNLADIYRERTKGEKAENLELSIQYYNQALEAFTKETKPLQRALIMMNLANIYRERTKGEKAENLELSIQYCNQALEVFTKETLPTCWAWTTMSLGLAYIERIKGDKAENLELSIQYCNQVLEVFTKETKPINWALTITSLGLAYIERIKGDKAENLELSIQYCNQALEILTKETTPTDWATVTMNLGFAYIERIKGDKAENLELSIKYCNQVLEILTKETTPIKWAMTTMNLGFAYIERIKGDKAENLELSIKYCNQALEILTKETTPIKWAMTTMNLGLAYIERIKGDKAENLELSIQYCSQALVVFTKETVPLQWALTMMNLASIYRKRIKGDKAENLELSIKHCNDALEVFAKETTPINWAWTTINLGLAYIERIEGDKAENLELSIKCCNEALEVFTKETIPIYWALTTNNLAVSYIHRIKGNKVENLETAIKCLEQSLEVFSPNSFPNDCRRVADGLASLYFGKNEWEEATKVYKKAINAAENLYKTSILRYSKEAELAENRDLYHLAAYSFTCINNLEEAIVILERAKARRLSEILKRERTDLKQIEKEYPNAYKFYQDAVINLRQLENEELIEYTISLEPKHHLTSEDLQEWANKAKKDLDTAIEKINSIPGYEKFLAQPDFTDIENAVEPDCPLVYLVTTPAGSLSLIVSKFSKPEKDGKISVESIWSDSLTKTSLKELLDNWFGAYKEIKKVQEEATKEGREKAQKLWLETIEKTTKSLWEQLMGKVTQHLLEMKAQRAVLIPMGYLALLPLHGAWTDLDGKRHYALDDVTFTYAPSAVALSHSRQFAEKVSTQKLLAVVEPKPVTSHGLPNANIEADSIASLFKSPNIFKHEDATRSAVLEKLPEADIVHFSCHGATNWKEPLKSGLLMAENEMITARDLFQLGLKGARMATLSACETGIVGLNLPDEAIGLPAAFLQAGFAGVVASLWLVDDLSTAMLMERFYQLWRSEGTPPAQALQKAQQWLRDTTNKEKADYFGKDLFSIFSASAVRMSGVTATEFYDKLSYDLTDEYKFEHPFYWAAFSLTGV